MTNSSPQWGEIVEKKGTSGIRLVYTCVFLDQTSGMPLTKHSCELRMFSGFAGSGFFWFLDSTLFSDSLSMSLHGKESGAFGTTSWDLDGKFLSFSWPCFTVVFPV